MFNLINQNVELPVYSVEGKEVRKQSVEDLLFGIEPHLPSVQLAVRVELANARRATAKTKTRAEVSGGGKKPWRQKGTGRARAGSTRSPIFRHGGTVFGPTGNENHKLKINKKVFMLALFSVLSDKAMKNDVMLLDIGKGQSVEDLPAKSTKTAAKMLESMGVKKGEGVLVIVDGFIENLFYSVRNIENSAMAHYTNLSVYDIMSAKKLVITTKAMEELNAMVHHAEEEEVKEAK